MHPRLTRLADNPRFVNILALLGGLVFLLQLWIYAHQQTSVLDEGLYLYKGLLFASGKYQPFQDYGPLTNHMPLSFLIPGYIQLWFAAGLRTGRYFSIILSMVMLLGVWISTHRLGGKWLACLAVWMIALNPANAKIFSMAISQVLISCMLIWIIVLVVGTNRPFWQVTLGGGLAAILVLTRINMLLTLPLVLLFIFWQHGKRAGIAATILSVGIFIALHVIYWPNILRMWAYWLPPELTPFLAAWHSPAGALPTWDPHPSRFSRLMSFFQSLRIHFFPWIGLFIGWLLWPRKSEWKSLLHYRAAFLFSALFVSNAGMHAWASLENDYCVSCFPIYTAFFSLTGILLLITVLSSWIGIFSSSRQALSLLLVPVVALCIGFGSFQDFNELFPKLAHHINTLKVSGDVELFHVLSNRLNISEQTVHQGIKAIPSTILGFLVGMLIIILAWLISRYLNRKLLTGHIILVLLIIVGLLLTPTKVLGNSFTSYDCTGDTLASYEQVGNYLASTIPVNSLVYWKGGLSPVPLLYLPDIHIYPSQLNGDYSLRQGGVEDALLRYGWWSMPLAEKWIGEADILLVEQQYYFGWFKKAIRHAGYSELPPSPPTSGCRPDSQILIFHRNP